MIEHSYDHTRAAEDCPGGMTDLMPLSAAQAKVTRQRTRKSKMEKNKGEGHWQATQIQHTHVSSVRVRWVHAVNHDLRPNPSASPPLSLQ